MVRSAQEAALEWVVREASEGLPFKPKPECHKGVCRREETGLGTGSENLHHELVLFGFL